MNTEIPPAQPSETRSARRKSSGAFWGLVLIIAGLIIFAQQTGLLSERLNWWALFILIPAFTSIARGFNAWQKLGKFDTAARSAIGGGVMILTVALIFLFGLDWSIYWALMVIAAGFSVFLNGLVLHDEMESLISTQLWIGLGGMYLGLGFLAEKLNWLNPQAYFGVYQWWAVAILIAGVGALMNALILAARTGKFFGSSFTMTVFGLLVTATGVVAFLGISWSLFGPILLIVLGISIMPGVFTRKT